MTKGLGGGAAAASSTHKKTLSNQGAPLTFTVDRVGPVKGGHHVRKHTYGGTFGMMSPS